MPVRVNESKIRIVVIREPGEIAFYSDVLTRQHYLKSSSVNRKTILHVARRGRRDIAILTWEPEVRRWFGLRDRLVGWTKEQREQRLKYCVENRRFLVLEQEKNLASQVLSASLERLNRDGVKQFGHEFLLAETFVDPSRGYDGGCYKANGWREVGLTQGGRGKQERSRKLYFVKDLKADALSKLKSPNLSPNDISNPRQKILSLERIDFVGLKRELDKVPEYRKNSGVYPLTAMLALIVVAVLCGETNAKNIHRWISGLSVELLKSLGCRKAPSYPTIWRTISNIDHESLCQVLCGWLSKQAQRIHIDKGLKILSLDGKNLRGASKGAGVDVHVLTLIDSITQTIRSQKLVNHKSNEIPCAPELLESAGLDASAVVTADAMHTQRETAETILKKTLTTSSPSKTTKRASEKQLQSRPHKNSGQYRSVLRNLRMGV